MRHHVQAWHAATQLAQLRRGPIGRPFVHHDHLQVQRVATRGVDEVGDQRREIAFFVARREDDGNFHGMDDECTRHDLRVESKRFRHSAWMNGHTKTL
jgi:hypothetical protein